MKALVLTLAILLVTSVALADELTPTDPTMVFVDQMATSSKCILERVIDNYPNPHTILYLSVCQDGSITAVGSEVMTKRPNSGGPAHP